VVIVVGMQVLMLVACIILLVNKERVSVLLDNFGYGELQ
jgi:hypothetical protein